MKDSIKSVLSFENYIVESIIFKRNLHFENREAVEVEFNLEKEVNYDDNKKEGSVHVTTTIFDNAEENNYPFYMEIKVIGFFGIETEKENPISLLEINAVAILFPYIRALISTYTANANVQPLILPPINVNNL